MRETTDKKIRKKAKETPRSRPKRYPEDDPILRMFRMLRAHSTAANIHEFAEDSGISAVHLRFVTTGRSDISLRRFVKVCEASGVKPSKAFDLVGL